MAAALQEARRESRITTQISNEEARERYNLNTAHNFTLFSEGKLNEETIGKVCAAIVEWTIVMGSMPSRNAKFNANLGHKVSGPMGSHLMMDAEYSPFASVALRFVTADAELQLLMQEHKILSFELNGSNRFFDAYSMCQ